jgi:ribonuclease HI
MNIYADGSGTNGITSSYCICREDGEVIKYEVFEDKATNNEMEYKAVIEGLRTAKDGDIVFTDSLLAVNQVAGTNRINVPHLRPLAGEARRLLKTKDVKLRWIGRADNVAGWYLANH